MNHFKDMKKIHEDEQKAVFRNKNGHEVRVAKKPLSSGMLKQLSNLPLHSAEGNYVEDPEEFEPGKDYSNSQLPGEGNASFAPQPEAEPERDPYAEQLSKPMGGAFEESAPPVEDSRALAEQPEPMPESEPQAEQPVEEAPAESAPPHQASAPAQRPAAPQRKKEQVNQELNKEAAAWANDLQNGHITPQTYGDLYAKKDTLGKIGTIFGLMMSGAGSALAGQPNAALEVMDKEIQRDLEAQKQSKSNAVSYMTLNMNKLFNRAQITKLVQEGKLTEAQAANMEMEAKIKAGQLSYGQMLLAGSHSLQSATNKLPSGPNKAVGQAAANKVSQAVGQKVLQGNAEVAQQLDPEEAFRQRQQMHMAGVVFGAHGASEMLKYDTERHVPGVGDASVPVPQSARDEMIAHDKLHNAATDLLEYSKTHTNLLPKMPGYNTGVQKVMVLQQMVRDGLLGTVYRPGEQPLLDAFVGDKNPASAFKKFSTQPKIMELIAANARASNTTKKGYGLPTKKSGGENQSQTMEKFGAKYQKVNGGWKKITK